LHEPHDHSHCSHTAHGHPVRDDDSSHECPTPVVDIEGLTFGYGGEPVLRDVSLKLVPNDLVSIIGPNGGGKTTLLKLPAQAPAWTHRAAVRHNSHSRRHAA
jgi:ABC-type Mn2+/Zn2+ transport system ATPase subunit